MAAPVLDAIPAQSTTQLAPVSFTATASNLNVDSLTFSLSDEPAGATIDATSGQFTWAPDLYVTPGDYSVTVIVSDGQLTDSQVVAITVAAANPTMHLALDEAHGAAAFVDSSINGNHVTCNSAAGECPSADQRVVQDDAIFLDGVDDYLTFGHVVNPNTDFAAAAWFKVAPDDGSGVSIDQLILGQERTVADSSNSLNPYWPESWLTISDQDGLESTLGLSGGNDSITRDQWHHAAVVRENSTYKLYLDGVLVDGQVGGNEDNTGTMFIGSLAAAGGRNEFFNGSIDEVVIFDRGLTADEVATLASTGNSNNAAGPGTD